MLCRPYRAAGSGLDRQLFIAVNWKNKKVAVTGAGGFIGGYLCKALVSEGATVMALDNFEIGSREVLNPILSEIRLLQCDITQREQLEELAGAEVVFHLAAIASPKACVDNFPKAYQVNVEGTKNVLEACAPGTRLIFLSGAIVYGEPLYIPVDENHPLRGRDPYSLTKVMGECLCWAMMATKKLQPTVVRNFTTYGPGQSAAYVIPSLITQGLNEKKIEVWNDRPSRDFTYVDDAVNALVSIAQTPSLVGEVVNLGSGVETRIAALATLISNVLGELPVVNLNKEVVGSARQSCANAKLRDSTQWAPKVPLNEGIPRTIEWLRRNPPK